MFPLNWYWTFTSGGTPPPPAPFAGMGGGFPTGDVARRKPNPYEDERKLDRDALRGALEAAFADAPRDAVVVATKRAHPLPDDRWRLPHGTPRVDWTPLLRNLAACERVLDRYAARIAEGRTRTQRGQAAREDLRYSEETIRELVDRLREQRRKRRKRAAIALLLE